MLGQGTFGQVVECIREDHGHERLAVKVIKNQQAYFQQVQPRNECGVCAVLLGSGSRVLRTGLESLVLA